MLEFLAHLFDTSGFPPRWHCGDWSVGHGWLHILSDLGVWSAYVTIPAVLAFFVLRKRDIPFRAIFILFGLFILACGTTHLMEALIFWWPAYRLAGVIKLLTALVSWATVFALIPVTPRVLAMRSPEALQREIDARRGAETALREANAELNVRLEALRASEERFRLLVDGTHDHALYLLDTEGRIVSWNAGAERLKQYRAEEIIGRHFSVFYPAEAVAAGKPQQQLQAAAAQGQCEDEGWRVRRDGSRFWASAVVTALRDETGQLRGFSKITRDVTVRKQAEEHAHRLVEEASARKAAEECAEVIRAQREQLHVTLHSIGDGVIATDAAGHVTLLNPVAEKLTGWTDADARGQPLPAIFRIINEQTRKPVENPADRVLREGVVGLANHTLLIARGGTERPIDDSAAPIRDAAGQIGGVVLVFRDATEKRQAEAALQEAARRKDEFLALLGHELRNPLGPILHAVQLLHRKTDEPALVIMARDMIDRQAQQMSRLVDDLLDASRIARGKIQLKPEPLDLAALTRTAVGDQQTQLDTAGLTVTLEVPARPVWIRGDPARLTQVIGNLLSNARKYTDPGGRVTVRLTAEDGRACLSVEDTGVGIPAAAMPQLFEAFSQLEVHRDRSSGGLGLGLAVVKGLIELHAGTVQVHSDGPGRGSRFTLELPLAAAPVALAAPEAPRHAARALRVLVVDDNVDGATSLSMLLRFAGHEVQVAHDGPTGLELAAQFHPEVALLDIGLPHGMDGYEVARRLRQQPGNEAVLPIALTGYGQEADQHRSQAAGFLAHLVKPIKFAVLHDLLARLRDG